MQNNTVRKNRGSYLIVNDNGDKFQSHSAANQVMLPQSENDKRWVILFQYTRL